MKKYLIVIENTETGFSAYSPDLECCVATGETRKEVDTAIQEAVNFHLEGLQEEGYSIPEPCSYSTYVDVAM